LSHTAIQYPVCSKTCHFISEGSLFVEMRWYRRRACGSEGLLWRGLENLGTRKHAMIKKAELFE